jgi:hypothetical protein
MAYFDYQRTRVFVRTSPLLKKHGRRTQHRKSWKNRRLRASHRVEVTASKCPLCRSKEIIVLPSTRKPKNVQTRSKRAFDIVITPSSVKRKVIDVRTVAYRCLRCKHCFVPGRYERLARHFHGFMSWSAYHQITHRLGAESLAALFYEAFGITMKKWEFFDFRHLLARYYSRLYRELLASILAGACASCGRNRT